jgi:hypothetical protein
MYSNTHNTQKAPNAPQGQGVTPYVLQPVDFQQYTILRKVIRPVGEMSLQGVPWYSNKHLFDHLERVLCCGDTYRVNLIALLYCKRQPLLRCVRGVCVLSVGSHGGTICAQHACLVGVRELYSTGIKTSRSGFEERLRGFEDGVKASTTPFMWICVEGACCNPSIILRWFSSHLGGGVLSHTPVNIRLEYFASVRQKSPQKTRP